MCLCPSLLCLLCCLSCFISSPASPSSSSSCVSYILKVPFENTGGAGIVYVWVGSKTSQEEQIHAEQMGRSMFEVSMWRRGPCNCIFNDDYCQVTLRARVNSFSLPQCCACMLHPVGIGTDVWWCFLVCDVIIHLLVCCHGDCPPSGLLLQSDHL